jgi:hypothetical protein
MTFFYRGCSMIPPHFGILTSLLLLIATKTLFIRNHFFSSKYFVTQKLSKTALYLAASGL